MNFHRAPASDANNVRSIVTFLGCGLLLVVGIVGWLAYVVLSKPPEKPLPDEIVPLLTALGTVMGVIVGQLGSLLARTSTAPAGATTNVVNAAPQGDPPSPTVNTTNIGGPPDGGATGTPAPVTFGGSGGSSAGAAITFTGDAPGVVSLG